MINFKLNRTILFIGIFILLTNCKPINNSLFYNLSEFNLDAGNRFVEKINSIKEVNVISLVDADSKNNYKVNGQSIFNDTVQINQPNFYSYVKRANELGVDAEKLNELLSNFKEIKVSEFVREDGFYDFPVEKYALSKQTGYLYKIENDLKVGDTIFTDSNIFNTYVLKKRIDKNWFEYECE